MSNTPIDGAPEPTAETESKPETTVDSVYKLLVYGLSLPERTIRSTTGIVGGVVKESASYLVPQAFRNSRSYKSFVGQMLEFMVNDVGGVPKTEQELAENPDVENYVARKTVGGFVDLAGMATLHVSPLTVMAIISDIAHGSNTYLKELAGELQREGILEDNLVVNSTSDLLSAVGNASGKTADALGTPPLSLDGLQQTITQIRDSVAESGSEEVMSQQEIDQTWNEISKEAESQNLSLFEMSSAMTLATLNSLSAVTNGALSTIRVTGNMFDRHILRYYQDSLLDIANRGVYSVLADCSKPYVDSVWFNFSEERTTLTEEIVSGRLFGKAWNGLKSWVSPSNDVDANPNDKEQSNDNSDGKANRGA